MKNVPGMKRDLRRETLAARIEAERLALANAPRIAVVTDAVLRCGGCGKVVDQLYTLAGPLHPKQQMPHRRFCGTCHPEMRAKLWGIL